MIREALWSRRPTAALAAILLAAAACTARTAQAAERDDAAWLRTQGTLLFADDFDREEDGNLAAALGIPASRVGIKATTNERMGFVGRGEGIAALAVASVLIPDTL